MTSNFVKTAEGFDVLVVLDGREFKGKLVTQKGGDFAAYRENGTFVGLYGAWERDRAAEAIVDRHVLRSSSAVVDVPPAATWIAAEDMAVMPTGWYWAEYPGGWEFFKQERNATLGIDHGHNGWQPLMAKRYWGPFKPPGVQDPAQPITN